MLQRLAPAVPLVAMVAVLAGCSSSGGEEKEDADASPATTVCAADAKAVALPKGFPADFPFPTGAVVYRTEDRGDAGVIVTAVTDTEFPATLTALRDGMAKANYRIGSSESEPHDAEAEWTTATFKGRWALRELTSCGDTLLNVVARPVG